MKHIHIVAVFIILAFSLASCDSYFDVKLNDQANIDDIFSQSSTTHKYLANLYSYLPLDEEIIGSDGWVVGRSDESMFSFYQWVYYLPYRTGNYSSATPTSTTYFNFWKKYYVAINQCSIFMDHVGGDVEDTDTIRTCMKAEARFLRAFYYYCLFRQYGPVYLAGQTESDASMSGATIDRNTVEENVDFMVSELDEAASHLPLRISEVGESSDRWEGRATKGAAMALKARILMLAASPLYNGCDLYKGKMKNMEGKYLFPQTSDDTKWDTAAKACLDVINLNMYSLCQSTDSSDPMQRGADSYENVFFTPWNSETIFGWWKRTSSGYSYMGGAGAPLGCACPPGMFLYGFGGIAPSLKLVDSYPMWNSGRYPVTGYQGQNDYSKPIIDPQAGYTAEGFTDDYKQPVDASWAQAITANNSTIGRDPRYYACIVPNGFYWPSKSLNKKFTCYNNSECSSPWSATNGCVRVGYAWRKYYPPDTPLKEITDYKGLKQVYPEIRLAEIYLDYAEACNEKPDRDEETAFIYLNKVRNRVGLNNIEDAYPEIKGNKELLRWCIRKERMVEFGMEAMRHYDACRWMIAKNEYPTDNWTLNVSATNYKDSYKRVNTDFVGDPATFADRDYLFPISSTQLSEMTNMTQNYGF